MPRVVIVGAGISGLVLAYRLRQARADLELTLLEAEPRVGGRIDTLAGDGFVVEAGPNGFLSSKPAMWELCAELGLANRLVPASETAARNRFVLIGGRLRRIASPFDLLRADWLGWPAKLGLLLERLRPPRPPRADESIDSFARRRLGKQAAEGLVDAFVTGIYAGDPRLLSMAACFPRLAALERDHGSVLGGLARERAQRKRAGEAATPPRLWSFPDGLTALSEALRQRLLPAPVLGARAVAVDQAEGTWRVQGADGRARSAEAVVLTCPGYEQAQLLGAIAPELAAEIADIAYNRIAVVALGYHSADIKTPLDGFGYLSPRRQRRDVLGVQWCSSIFPNRAPPGMALLRALCGGWNRPDLVDWDDDRLVAAVHRELSTLLGVRAAPVFRKVIRWDRAIPQYLVGHLQRVARIEALAAARPGLFLGGSAYRGVALNDCVEQASALAQQVAQFLFSRARRPMVP